jgi:hypothetical protein
MAASFSCPDTAQAFVKQLRKAMEKPVPPPPHHSGEFESRFFSFSLSPRKNKPETKVDPPRKELARVLFEEHARGLTDIPLALNRMEVRWEQVLKDLRREQFIVISDEHQRSEQEQTPQLNGNEFFEGGYPIC